MVYGALKNGEVCNRVFCVKALFRSQCLLLGTVLPMEVTTEAKFLVPDWGDIVDSGIGLLYRPPAHVTQLAGTTALCQSRLYPRVRY
jgi:hypothetical protein